MDSTPTLGTLIYCCYFTVFPRCLLWRDNTDYIVDEKASSPFFFSPIYLSWTFIHYHVELWIITLKVMASFHSEDFTDQHLGRKWSPYCSSALQSPGTLVLDWNTSPISPYWPQKSISTWPCPQQPLLTNPLATAAEVPLAPSLLYLERRSWALWSSSSTKWQRHQLRKVCETS